MTRFVGWRVHGWSYPLVWWARRKPYSSQRQWAWALSDRIKWWQTMRAWKRAKRRYQ